MAHPHRLPYQKAPSITSTQGLHPNWEKRRQFIAKGLKDGTSGESQLLKEMQNFRQKFMAGKGTLPDLTKEFDNSLQVG